MSWLWWLVLGVAVVCALVVAAIGAAMIRLAKNSPRFSVQQMLEALERQRRGL